MARRARSRLTPAQSGIAEILGADRFVQLAMISNLRKAWPEIVGPMMADRTEPISIEKDGDVNCLFIAVDHPVMSQQIRFLRDDIRKACFKRCRIGNLAKVRTRVQEGAGIKVKTAKAKKRPVPFADKRLVAAELAPVRDKSLRRAMFEARIAQLANAVT